MTVSGASTVTTSMLDAAAASPLLAGRVGLVTAGLGFSVKVNFGGRTNLGRDVTPDSDGTALLELVESDAARVDSVTVTAGFTLRELALENGNCRREGTSGDATEGSITTGLMGAGLLKEEAVRAVVGETVSALSSVVISSSIATVGGVVGLANRGVAVDTELTTALLAIVLLDSPVDRTPLLKMDGRRGANPPRLLRAELIDGTKLMLENRRPGRPVEEADKTGVGLMPPELDGEPAKDDRKRKNWLPLLDEDSVAVLLAATIGEAPEGRNRLLNGVGRLMLPVEVALLPLIEAGLGTIDEVELISSPTLAALVKGGRLGLIGKGGRGRWVNGRMEGTKVRLRGGAERRVVIRPPSTFVPSLSCSSTPLSAAGDVLIVCDGLTGNTIDPSNSTAGVETEIGNKSVASKPSTPLAATITVAGS